MKKRLLKLIRNPFGVYALWIIILILFCFIGIPLLSIGYSGGSQRPFTLLAHTLNAAVFGFILISIISPITHWKWHKRYSFIPLIVPVLITILLSWLIVDIYVSNGNYFAF